MANSWLKVTEVDTAVETAGVYAWYARLTFGPTDWQAALDPGGRDHGMAAFGTLLKMQTRRLVPPGLRVGAVGHLWARWSGPLEEGGSIEIRKAIDLTHKSPAGGPAALQRVMLRADLRRATAEILAECSPQVAAPIYIGVAKNLRDRLKTHRQSLRDATEYLSSNGGTPSAELRKTFGGRAAIAGFDEDTLMVSVFPVPTSTQDIDDRRTVAEAAEFLLNRWCRPILGRR